VQADPLPIVLICDDGYVMPTSVALTSLIANKKPQTVYDVNIITDGLSPESLDTLRGLASETVSVNVINASAERYLDLHVQAEDSICVASPAALLKFELPILLPSFDRALYLDGDVVVREDLSPLFQGEMGDALARVVSDSGQIYFKHSFVKRTNNYFNSGMMVLNLALMRELGMTETLIQAKRELADSSLMDQNVFNVVFDGRVQYWPIRYNFLYVNLLRAAGKYSIEQVNDLYGTQYSSLEEIEKDAAVVHYSSKDKPWKYSDIPLAGEWYEYYLRSPYGSQPLVRDTLRPSVSVVIPAYNVEAYLGECLDSVLGQTLQKIEVICVDDGSTDGTAGIMAAYARQDKRVRTVSQKNAGQSAARNKALALAQGEYVYLLDSDDYIERDALEILYAESKKHALDVLYFDADSFFESDELRRKHSTYEEYYQSKGQYEGVHDGPSLFAQLVSNGDYRPSPCLQFIRREYLNDIGLGFYNGIIHEDNLFSLLCILQANKARHIKKTLFHRRVRPSSTMTSVQNVKNFRGYFICMSEMFKFLQGRSISEEVADAAFIQVTGMYRQAARVLVRLPHSEKIKIQWPVGSTEDLFYRLMNSQVTTIRAAEKQRAEATKKLKKIRKSKSYKLGRALTAIPRKIRRLLKRSP